MKGEIFMVLKNNMKKIASHLLVALLAVGLAGCGGNNVVGGGTSSGGNNGGTSNPGTSNPGNVSNVTPPESSVLDGFDFDLEIEDGEPVFDEEVVIKVWSINGDPDKAVQKTLFDTFNSIQA